MRWIAVSAALVAALLVAKLLAAQEVVAGDDRAPRFLLASTTPARPPARVDVDRTPVLRRRISVTLLDVPLAEALTVIASRSGLDLAYSKTAAPLDRIVRLDARDITVAAALTEVLLDAQMDVVFSPAGRAMLVKRGEGWFDETGTITGRVTDHHSGSGLEQVTVWVEGTSLRASTQSDGGYRITSVSVGAQTVTARRLGYGRQSRSVVVVADQEVAADFALELAPTTLDEVVVTVTGEQRRVEIGNVIGTIAADSLVRDAPVSRLSELLEARIPGLQTIQNSGHTGATPRLRIRGIGSVSLPRDPLLYVDGVRVDNSTGSVFSPLGGFIGGYGQRSGRLNDFKPEEIESIEVVKGPSAATLYGTDAANGVILIRTKRGRAGHPTWNVYSEAGTLTPSARAPDNYYSWGRNATSGAVQRCVLQQAAAGTCTIDSLTRFSPLNHPETTPIGTGHRDQVGAQVSGGAEQLRYFFSGDYEFERSYLEMPAGEVRRIQAERGGAALPDWQLHPNQVRRVNLRGNVSATLGQNADLNVSTGFVTSDSRIPRGSEFSSAYFGAGYRDAFDGWSSGVGRPGEFFSVGSDETVTHWTSSLNGNWRPRPWLATHGTAGIDFSSALFQGIQRRGEGFFGTGRNGTRLNDRTTATLYTVDLGASAFTHVSSRLTSKTSVGAQYNRRDQSVTEVSATGLPPGSVTTTGAAVITGGEQNVQSVVAGSYVEQVVGLNERVFVTGAVRADGASAFGRNFNTAFYPKASVSWLVSEEPFFPVPNGVDVLRLRAAFGGSGVQPGSTDALALMRLFGVFVDGVAANGAALRAIGNPDLKPEKQQEVEVGFDAEVLGRRVTLEATYYNRLSKDALIQRPLPPSVGVATRWENIGSVRNWGYEALLNARIVQSSQVSWDVILNGSINHNRLEELNAPGLKFIGGNPASRNRVGYSLWSGWDRPILSYSDANGNGIIEAGEVVVGDTVVFLGPAHPPRQLTTSSVVSLFSNRLRISSQFDYRGGHVAMNFSELNRCVFFTNCVASNDPKAPLGQQARVAAFIKTGTWAGYMEDASFVRWREFAVTYQAPDSWARWFGGRSLSMTLAGRNLRLWTHYSGADPEASVDPGIASLEGANSNPTMPPTRYWTLRINLGL